MRSCVHVRSVVMIQLSIGTAAAAAAVKLATQHAAAALSHAARATTKEGGGELGPPRHELKPDNETRTRFHRHKASAERR